jgi:hypothetical protein
MSDQNTAKRIPKSLGTDTKLLGNYTLTDAAVALLPGVLIILASQILMPPTLSVGGYRPQQVMLPLAAVAIAVGAIFVYLTPPYATSLEWLTSLLRFRTTPSYEAHDTAPEHTQVERVWPDHDAIERQDGAMVGLVQVSPPPMALATDAEWAAKADSFQNFLNTTVTFPIQLFSTTRPFPVETYLDRYRDRLDDPDVQDNPRLAELIEAYIEWYERDLAARQMTIRDHYVVVQVTPAEVQFSRGSLLETLCELPVVGPLLTAWTAPPLAEQRAAMFETLSDRLDSVQRGIRDIDDCRAQQVDATTAAQVIEEYWAGRTQANGEMATRLRSRPLVGGPA